MIFNLLVGCLPSPDSCSDDAGCGLAFGPGHVCGEDGYCLNVGTSPDTSPPYTPPTETGVDTPTGETGGTTGASDWLVGDLLITEVMATPQTGGAPRVERQWFELHNVSGRELDLNGVSFASEAESVTVTVSILIEPDARLVIAASADEKKNGGLPEVAWAWETDSNPSFKLATAEGLLRVDAPDGTWVAVVPWASGWFSVGKSMELDPSITDPSSAMLGSSWCVTPAEEYGDGGFGSPGAVNGCGAR